MEPGLVAQAYNQHSREAEAGGSRPQGLPGLQRWPDSRELFGQPICPLWGLNSPGRLMANTQGVVRTSSQEGLPSHSRPAPL